MSSTLRSQHHRSRLSQDGMKRLDVVLTPQSQENLAEIQRIMSLSKQKAVEWSLEEASREVWTIKTRRERDD